MRNWCLYRQKKMGEVIMQVALRIEESALMTDMNLPSVFSPLVIYFRFFDTGSNCHRQSPVLLQKVLGYMLANLQERRRGRDPSRSECPVFHSPPSKVRHCPWPFPSPLLCTWGRSTTLLSSTLSKNPWLAPTVSWTTCGSIPTFTFSQGRWYSGHLTSACGPTTGGCICQCTRGSLAQGSCDWQCLGGDRLARVNCLWQCLKDQGRVGQWCPRSNWITGTPAKTYLQILFWWRGWDPACMPHNSGLLLISRLIDSAFRIRGFLMISAF